MRLNDWRKPKAFHVYYRNKLKSLSWLEYANSTAIQNLLTSIETEKYHVKKGKQDVVADEIPTKRTTKLQGEELQLPDNNLWLINMNA